MPTYGDVSAEDQNLLTANLSWEEQKLITVKRQEPLNNHNTEVIPWLCLESKANGKFQEEL